MLEITYRYEDPFELETYTYRSVEVFLENHPKFKGIVPIELPHDYDLEVKILENGTPFEETVIVKS